MDRSEKLALLKGSIECRRKLFQFLVDKVSAGEQLEDDEVAMLQFLKSFFAAAE